MTFRKFQCAICDHVYDEAAGDPAFSEATCALS